MTYEAKTTPAAASVADFIASVDHAGRRADADILIALLTDISGEPPILWGPDVDVLRELAERFWAWMQTRYPSEG